MKKKNRIYLDNAATTPLHPLVFDEMVKILKNEFGNPSSIHETGRRAKTYLESSRKTIAECLNVRPSEIFFTSGATESLNTVIRSLSENKKIQHIITSPIEHPAVLHTIDYVHKRFHIPISYVDLQPSGEIVLESLESLLKNINKKCLVSLMHVNNEIGNITPIESVAEICKEYDAYFLCDTVQSIGLHKINLNQLHIQAVVSSAHKLHGPKGVGFLYLKEPVEPFIHGGAQERNMRGGTENLPGIVGMAKAFELASNEQEERYDYLKKLKLHFIKKLKEHLSDIQIIGSEDVNKTSPKIINLMFLKSTIDDLFLFKLDIEGIDASAGSACSSGSQIGSHVLHKLFPESKTTSIRFSFSIFNTIQEIDEAIAILKKCYNSCG